MLELSNQELIWYRVEREHRLKTVLTGTDNFSTFRREYNPKEEFHLGFVLFFFESETTFSLLFVKRFKKMTGKKGERIASEANFVRDVS